MIYIYAKDEQPDLRPDQKRALRKVIKSEE